ncbi:hypothetical protein PHYPSEUDO_007570 [Phytophthora pseudosyringae]|uniref:Uncharacterized protein n=1 Tax=Phytophthora pseudosyringae TaxID=221518 RepID=A0A8T1VLM0_9STRA|nr:hypothetical protein PHYPSEUDO_007570 [Phytophthora pseudosyringae]
MRMVRNTNAEVSLTTTYDKVELTYEYLIRGSTARRVEASKTDSEIKALTYELAWSGASPDELAGSRASENGLARATSTCAYVVEAASAYECVLRRTYEAYGTKQPVCVRRVTRERGEREDTRLGQYAIAVRSASTQSVASGEGTLGSQVCCVATIEYG